MKLIFASNNSHKLKEVRAILGSNISVLSLDEVGIKDEIPETGNTLEENSFIKADYVFTKTKTGCFADDTGLFVNVMNGAPGVFSARFAGEQCSFQDNIDKLLLLMKNKSDRKAYFKTVICMLQNGKAKYFDGTIHGTIREAPKGTNGFGYDSVFVPDGFTKTFAELSEEEKNSLSHRAVAVEKLKMFLLTSSENR